MTGHTNNPLPSTPRGVARTEVNTWLKGCSDETRRVISGHELTALRRVLLGVMIPVETAGRVAMIEEQG